MNTIARRSPTLNRLFRDQVNTLFGRPVEDLLHRDFFASPESNIKEEDGAYTLEIAVPGMNKRDISIQVEGSTLTIEAQKKETKTMWVSAEFNSTLIRRSFLLPANANAEKIHAKCRDGLLTVRIEKVKELNTYRTIKIQENDTPIKNNPGAKIDNWWTGLKQRFNNIFRLR
jgi:HSP20 family protein